MYLDLDFKNKFIDSFSWGKDAKVDFDKFIDTVEIMKNRRSKKLSKIEFKFLEKIYSKNKLKIYLFFLIIYLFNLVY